jgi:integrase/recombinase XerD
VIPGDPADARGFLVMVASYLEWRRVHHFSRHTVSSEEYNLGDFVIWADERGVSRPSEVTQPMLERYQRHLFYRRKRDGAPLSITAQKRAVTALKNFFRFLVKQHYLLSNPSSELELPRVEYRLPKAVLSIAEVEQVMAQPNAGEELGLRDRAILELFYATGMRRGELANLKLQDLDLERRTLVVRQGKNRKDRTLPIGERAALWLTRYLDEIRPRHAVAPDEGIVFLAARQGHALELNDLSQIVTSYVDRAKLGKRGSCHLFRHTMATLMLEGGADLRFIQQMLGHAKLETTEVYTRVSIQKLAAIHAATHPGARIVTAPASASVASTDAELSVEAFLAALDDEAREERIEALH